MNHPVACVCAKGFTDETWPLCFSRCCGFFTRSYLIIDTKQQFRFSLRCTTVGIGEKTRLKSATLWVAAPMWPTVRLNTIPPCRRTDASSFSQIHEAFLVGWWLLLASKILGNGSVKLKAAFAGLRIWVQIDVITCSWKICHLMTVWKPSN